VNTETWRHGAAGSGEIWRQHMKGDRKKIYALVVFLAITSIIVWITVNRMQQEPLLSDEPSPPSASEFEIFFGDNSCSWPCWQGITPGVTRISDALHLLRASPVVSKSTVQSEELKPGIGTARWDWDISNNQFEGDMEWRDGIVSRIGLSAYPIYSIGEIIDRFGPPEKISVIDCAMIAEAPQEWCASFYYAKRGFEINLKWKMPEYAADIQLSPSDPIRSVYLFEPSTITAWLLYLGIKNPQAIDLRYWKGYGNLLELYVR
jgi:hypothetical protein